MPRRVPADRSNHSKAFNPRLIFCQMVAMQCLHYLFLGFLYQANFVVFGTSITLDRIFTDKYLKIWNALGWVDNFAVLLAALVGAFLLAIIVEKSKKCLDFSVTLFIIHFCLCSLYNGPPATWDWYIVHVLASILMVLMGEYLCSRRELDDIPLLQL